MSTPNSPASPLDPFLSRFLSQIRANGDGIQQGAELRALAEDLDLPAAFVDGLFTSARKRGLLKPAYGRGSKVRWTVSSAGELLIDATVHRHERAGG